MLTTKHNICLNHIWKNAELIHMLMLPLIKAAQSKPCMTAILRHFVGHQTAYHKTKEVLLLL